MNNYPDYVHDEMIRYYESELIDIGECKDIAGKLIFDERMSFVWSALSKRANSKEMGRDADLVVMVDCQIPADDLVVHFL